MKNKKGFTLVEVIVSFTLIMIVMIYLLRTIMVLVQKNNDLIIYEEFSIYENNLLSDIYKDLDVVYDLDYGPNEKMIGPNENNGKIVFGDLNTTLEFDKVGRKIVYNNKNYTLPDNVDFREVNGKVYSVTNELQSIHYYYVITIYVKVNNNDEEIKIIYQNKKEGQIEITFDANGGICNLCGQETCTIKGNYGQTLGQVHNMPTATYEPNEFIDWFTKKTGGTKIDADTVIKEPKTYYAQWGRVYDIEYTLNGGYLGGTKCADENGICDFSGKRLICYGSGSYNCQVKESTVTCNSQSFGGDPAYGIAKACYISPVPLTYKTGDEKIIDDASKAGYDFKGWTGSNGTTPQKNLKTSKTAEGKLTYSANWDPSTYTVLLDGNNPTKEGSDSATVSYKGTKLSTITNPEKAVTVTYVNNAGATVNYTNATVKSSGGTASYSLKGWYTGTSSTSKVASNSTQPALQASISGLTNSSSEWIKTSGTTLYAQWSPLTITLPTISKSGGYTCKWTTDNGSSVRNSGGQWEFTSANSRTFTVSCSCPSNQYDVSGKCRTIIAKTCPTNKIAYNGLCYDKTGTTSSQVCSSGWTKETTNGTYCCNGSNCYTKGVCENGYTSKTITGPYCWQYRGDDSSYYHCDSGYAKWNSSGNTCWKCNQTMFSGWSSGNGWEGPWPETTSISNAWYCGTWYSTSGTTYTCPSGYRMSGTSCCITYSMKTSEWCSNNGGTWSQGSQTTRNGTGNCVKCQGRNSKTTTSSYYVEGGWERGTEHWEWTYTSTTTQYSCASGYTKVDNSTCRKNSGGTSPTVCSGTLVNGTCYSN